jgi:hypothetical protein
MSPRIVIAALSLAVIGAAIFTAAPSLAQTPEKSPAAMVAPKAQSESATASSGAMGAPPAATTARAFSVDRSAKDTTGGKAALVAPTSNASK